MKKTLFILAAFSPVAVLAQSTGTVCTEQIIAGQRVMRCVSGTPTYSPRPEVQLPALNAPVPVIQAPAPPPAPVIRQPIYSPPTNVSPVQQQETINNFLTESRKVLHPQGLNAASIAFNTGQKPSGSISTCANTSYRVPNWGVVNISTVPGDFAPNIPNCYFESYMEGAENFNITYYTNAAQVPFRANDYCILSPNTTYYYNMKFVYPDGRPGCPTDDCGLFVDFM